MMTYLKSKEVESERVNESVSISFTWTMILCFTDRMRRSRGIERDFAKHTRARDYRDRNMYKSLYTVERTMMDEGNEIKNIKLRDELEARTTRE